MDKILLSRIDSLIKGHTNIIVTTLNDSTKDSISYKYIAIQFSGTYSFYIKPAYICDLPIATKYKDFPESTETYMLKYSAIPECQEFELDYIKHNKRYLKTFTELDEEIKRLLKTIKHVKTDIPYKYNENIL